MVPPTGVLLLQAADLVPVVVGAIRVGIGYLIPWRLPATAIPNLKFKTLEKSLF